MHIEKKQERNKIKIQEKTCIIYQLIGIILFSFLILCFHIQYDTIVPPGFIRQTFDYRSLVFLKKLQIIIRNMNAE